MCPDHIAPDMPNDSKWGEAIGALIDSGARRILVLGAVDAGKSTFCRLLLAATAARECGATLIDADIGQKMVGPPATVTLARAQAPDMLAALAFVGTTDPVAGFSRLIDGLAELRRDAGAGLLVVNTSGYLHGAGRRLKSAKVAVVEPDVLVAIGEDSAAEAVLSEHPTLRHVHLTPAIGARHKGPGCRRAARREAFRRYLEGAALHDLNVPKLGPSLCEGLLVGLTDKDGRHLALGVVEELDSAGDRARIRSPAPAGAAGGLAAGRMRLDWTFDARLL